MFIVMDGPDGSGKSTQAKMLEEWLTEQGVDVLLTKEPGSSHSKECQVIRKILLDPENDLDPVAELFLYWADRAQHVSKVIHKAWDEGKWVISDRFFTSTYAYQGCGRDMQYMGQGHWFWLCQNRARHDVTPQITFILDMPVEEGLKRAKTSNKEYEGGDRMEQEDLEFHQKVRDGFLEIVEDFGNDGLHQFFVLDATKSIEEIHEDIKQVVLQKLNERS